MNDNEPCTPCEEQVIEKLPPCPLQCRSEKCKSFKKVSFEGKPIVWLLGGPGSGKGTQCGMIIAKYGLTYLSIKDLLRDEMKSQSVRGKCLTKVIERGEDPPEDLILDLLKNAVLTKLKASQAKGFIIDGYPRKRSEGIAFEKKIAPCTVVINLDASVETLTKRMLSGGMRSGRVDDEQTLKLMVKNDIQNNELVLAHFTDKVYRIDAEQSVDEVFVDVTTILDPIMDKNAALLPSPEVP